MKNFFIKYKFIIFSYLICVILGTISHFLYELSNNFVLLKPFVSIDESVFEHLKLIFYPMIIVSLCESYIIYKNPLTLVYSRIIGAISACILITIFFFTYTSIVKKSIPFIDITSYYVFVLIGYIIAAKLNKYNNNPLFRKISILLLFIAIIFFSIFTEYKPNNDFFK